ncbi:hypothetical protein ABZ820_02610 [Streptomyces diacarni]|uniref:hypothetical protein n=1 Tax=Streptomyces diacarni TaxID=2800381 RepID=UPI003405EBC0
MGRSFTLHGGIAAGASAVLLLLAVLTWLPGTLPPLGSKWLMVAIVVLLFPLFIAALVRVFVSGADRRSMWLAIRRLPGRARAVLGALVVSGALLMLFDMAGAGSLQAPEVKDGRYFVLDTSVEARRTIEVSHSQYEAVLESDQRSMLAISGLFFAAAACVVFAAGELRRAEVGRRAS